MRLPGLTPKAGKGGRTMAEPGIFEIIYSTRAMRRLKPDPIPEETLVSLKNSSNKSWGFLTRWKSLR
jgi:hypothetical protein